MKFDIPGIDARKALELYDDDEEIYVAVLRSYAVNIPATLEKLRNLSAETLPAYMISIHGLKGTSANVGAQDLRHQAANLETLAKAGNFAEVQAKNPAFIKEAETLIANINAWLKENDT